MKLSEYLYFKFRDDYDWDIAEKDFAEEIKKDPIWQKYIDKNAILDDLAHDIIKMYISASDKYEIDNKGDNLIYVKLGNVEVSISVSTKNNEISFNSNEVYIDTLTKQFYEYMENLHRSDVLYSIPVKK